MPTRYLRWDDNQFVYTDMRGEPCEGDCITLVDDYASLSGTSMTWPRSVWESLAESIIFERDRRKDVESRKRWYVSRSGSGWEAFLSSDPDGRVGLSARNGFVDLGWVRAKDADEAVRRFTDAVLAYHALASEHLL